MTPDEHKVVLAALHSYRYEIEEDKSLFDHEFDAISNILDALEKSLGKIEYKRISEATFDQNPLNGEIIK